MGDDTSIGVFTPTGMAMVPSGKENEFLSVLSDMDNDTKARFVALNALGIVSLSLMREFEPIFISWKVGGPKRNEAALRRGIEAAGGNAEKVVKDAIEKFKKISMSDQAAILMLWMVH